MRDIQSYFTMVKETREGWKANCPRCEDTEMKLYWNTEKEVGCCFHSNCPWFKGRGGVTIRRIQAFLERSGIEYTIPEVIKAAPEADITLPEEFLTLKEMSKYDSEPIYDYLEARGLPHKVVDKARVGYCTTGKFWGYIIFPVFDDEGRVIYWQARSYKKREKKWHNPTFSAKGEILYRISSPKKPETIILVESIINLLTLETAHHNSHVAIFALLGSSMTDAQMDKILVYERRLKDIVIALDDDAIRAAVLMAERLAGIIPSIRIAKFPEGQDVNSVGREKAWQIIDSARVFKASERTRWMVGE